MEAILEAKIDESLLNRIELYAKKNNKAMSDILNESLSQYLEKNEKRYSFIVNNKEELFDAIRHAERQVGEGKIVPEEEVMSKIRKYAGH